MAKIEMIDGKLNVPNNPEIPYINGDGVGIDISPAMIEIVDTAVAKSYAGEKEIVWQELQAGEQAFEATGDYLPEATLTSLTENLIAIKGPLMTPIGGGFRSLNVTLRQNFDLFANVRPVAYFPGVASPVKHPENVNMTIFRENTEDIYAGIEFESESADALRLIEILKSDFGINKIRFDKTSAIGIKPVSPDGTKRLVRAAFDHAVANGNTRLTLVHKGNIMKFTEGGFKKWGYEVASEYPTFTVNEFNQIKAQDGITAAKAAKDQALAEGKIYVDDAIADNFLQQILLNPSDYQVVATLNLNGDYISDALAAQVGGIGISPGANINFITGHAIFEATHGTAPDIAGLGLANPSSLILSSVMMLEFMGWGEAATLVKLALAKAIASGHTTRDLGGQLTTAEFTKAVIENL
ncbi:MAG: NADP-dependent isocitrate dehydrogenase [Lactococcus raffinolactis]|jgi:isocitrate dehydrogenase|uniref:Isocitrate dehydrogenase [NADP] n=1 Tax=Pseudolactococcus raffinolactis TaxID=1366 RepID=A0A6H0V175_9LACT|nr:NADP-dependent isocitrate dehydrogenase [Lactococcus raffinolactis]MBR2541452.1 NADP-dependent isocitrate dehydrogenase [Lactococcus sp.]MBW9297924.1 NADP-dependent isocitrate dehydrogenase [Lactococcus raffinolactis]MBW9330163.1 NADP-dependent isocitrate dehydrogenase [Lactococcus raffinolactis]MCH4162179.1 NADP-dependent isocitrate dehydrogenase [Lactococcus raffinolactis]MDG4961042.1 NADP-dependent isocitrate dehydrogenase [Lactococcus raffinolactis]